MGNGAFVIEITSNMKLEDLSIRARVAFAIECLEKLINKEANSDFNWEESLLSKLWSYTSTNNLGYWHYLIGESIPWAVLEDLPYEEKMCDYINKSEHDELRRSYQGSSKELQNCIDLIFDIGTTDLYSSITNKSPRTILVLKEIILILEENFLQIPDIRRFENYQIDKEEGWGCRFHKSDLICY